MQFIRSRASYRVTPIGAIELIGTPCRVIWTGEKEIRTKDVFPVYDSDESISKKRKSAAAYEWAQTETDEAEVNALSTQEPFRNRYSFPVLSSSS